jgi:hypothetical protein
MLQFVLGLVLGIPLAILANLLTPRVQTWLAMQSERRKRVRIDHIYQDLAKGFILREDPSAAVGYIAPFLAILTIEAVLAASVLAISTVTAPNSLSRMTASSYTWVAVSIVAEISVGVTYRWMYGACRLLFDSRGYHRDARAQLAALGQEYDPVRAGEAAPDELEAERGREEDPAPAG